MTAAARGDPRATWSRGQTLKNDALAALVFTLLAIARPFPPCALRAAGRALGAAAYALARPLRRLALANLAIALPDASPRARRAIARRAFAQLGGHLGDAVAALGGRPPEGPPVDADARAVIAAARAAGRGVVLASAHLGPWEAVAGALVAAGVPLVAVTRDSYDPRLTPLQDRMRAARGVRCVPRTAPGAGARMLRVLRRGEVLGVPMDLRSRVASIEAPFFGRAASTPVGPARLALRTGAEVVVATVAVSGEVTATRVPKDDLAPGPLGERLLTARINAELCARILACPDAWVWMHPRFADAAPTESQRPTAGPVASPVTPS